MTGPIRLCAIGHGPWADVQNGLRKALDDRHLGNLFSPAAIILNDLLSGAIKAMHLQVFGWIMEEEFALPLNEISWQVEPLFQSEIEEHGIQNIVHACESSGKLISVSFPPAGTAERGALVQIDAPIAWDRRNCRHERLIDVLGLRIDVEETPEGSRIRLIAAPDRQGESTSPPRLIDPETLRDSMGRIFDQLGYGIIHFSAKGEVIAASPLLLERLQLDCRGDWGRTLSETIPEVFYNDIIWGQALKEGDGAFENFRIRISPTGPSEKTILFNISGFRDPAGWIHSLWQVVSEDAGTNRLSEGSIINGMRIHNITRHYVPQLVEQKARDAVQQGKTRLTNEERRVAVLFCDIVGFTSYVECNADSESIVDTLNFILGRVSKSVTRNRGFIDKFMGDSIMAIFNDPVDSVLAALDMQSHSADMNRLRVHAGQQPLQLRIGIHWGDVVICNVGTPERLDWTAIGDVVNTAARIEKGCKPGSVLISRTMRDAIESAQPGKFQYGEIFGIQAKGKRDELEVCDVAPLKKRPRLAFPAAKS